MLKLPLLGLSMALFAMPAIAQQAAEPALGGPPVTGVCFLSQQAVFAGSKVGEAASARLKALAQQAQAEIDAERAQIETNAKSLESQKASLKSDDFAARQKALTAQVQTLQAHASLRSREIEATREKALARIIMEVRPVVSATYTSHRCGLLVDKSAVLGGNMAGDLTAAVIEGLDARISTITFDREALPAATASQ